MRLLNKLVGSHSRGYEDFCPLGYNSVLSIESTYVSEEHFAPIFRVEE
jgi:hypothetical protein